MKIAVFFIAAILAYLISGINPAIELSKLIYHKDIRNEGSGNPGFTNFMRTFGSKYAFFVFILDISKALLIELIFGFLFAHFTGNYQLGIAFTGLFCMLGHAYPVWYKFKGGKAFLVCVTTLYMINWKAGLFATVILLTVLIITKYMSLASMISMLAGTISLFSVESNYFVIILMFSCTLFMIYRHKQNILRLFNGTENKFHLKHSSDKKKITTDNSNENQQIPAKVKKSGDFHKFHHFL